MSAIPSPTSRALAARAAHTLRAALAGRRARRRSSRRDRAAARARASSTVPLPAASAIGIVVLDLSASISTDTYSADRRDPRASCGDGRPLRAGRLLGRRVPGAAAGHAGRRLRRFARFFTVPPPKAPASRRRSRAIPWTNSFSAGTRISAGLGLALQLIRDAAPRRPRGRPGQRPRRRPGRPESLASVALAYRERGSRCGSSLSTRQPAGRAAVLQPARRAATIAARAAAGRAQRRALRAFLAAARRALRSSSRSRSRLTSCGRAPDVGDA